MEKLEVLNLHLKSWRYAIKYNKQFKDVYEALDLLLKDKQSEEDWEDRERIGFI